MEQPTPAGTEHTPPKTKTLPQVQVMGYGRESRACATNKTLSAINSPLGNTFLNYFPYYGLHSASYYLLLPSWFFFTVISSIAIKADVLTSLISCRYGHKPAVFHSFNPSIQFLPSKSPCKCPSHPKYLVVGLPQAKWMSS